MLGEVHGLREPLAAAGDEVVVGREAEAGVEHREVDLLVFLGAGEEHVRLAGLDVEQGEDLDGLVALLDGALLGGIVPETILFFLLQL